MIVMSEIVSNFSLQVICAWVPILNTKLCWSNFVYVQLNGFKTVSAGRRSTLLKYRDISPPMTPLACGEA